MDNRYLYKAKRTDNGEWVYGSLITGVFFRVGNDIPYILCPEKADYDCFEDFKEDNGIFEVDPSTICQCTGLVDKNGEPIFEGDIVKTNQYGKDDGQGHNGVGADKFCVVFDCGAYRLEHKWRRFNFVDGKHCEGIGNKFDNPELLEVK